MLHTFVSDLRFALRLYRRTPLQSLIAATVVALAVAFAASFYRLYDDLALRAPGGFEAPSELIGIGLSGAGAFDLRLPGRLRRAIAERSRTIGTVASVVYVDDEFMIGGEAIPARAGVVSQDFFEGLGVEMHIGRGLTRADARQAGTVTVLDHGFWQRRFGGDPAVLGEQIEIGGVAFTVVGVAHPRFSGTHRGSSPDAWFPLRSFAALVWNAQPDVIAEAFRMITVARLAAGETAAAARRELESLSGALRGDYRDDLLGLELVVLEHLAPDPQRHADAVRQVQLLAAAAMLLALIAASNLSLFFLARAPEREREIGIRLSIGATPRRLTRQLLTESSGLVAAGVVLGLIAHLWFAEPLRGLPAFAGVEWARPGGIDWTTAAYFGTLALALAAVTAAAPVLNLRRRSLTARVRLLKTSVARSQRMIVGAQIAIAAPALCIALLFAENLIRSARADVGYDATDVTVVRFVRAGDALPAGPEAITALREALADRLTAVASVQAVGFGETVPGIVAPAHYVVEAPSELEIPTRVARVAPSWFDVLGVDVLRGALPAPDEYDAAVVSRRFAELAWGDVDVVGERVRAPVEASPAGGADSGLSSVRVAAVIDDVQLGEPGGLMSPLVLINRPVATDVSAFMLVKGFAGPREIEAALSDALRQAPSYVEVARIDALPPLLEARRVPERARAALTGVAGGFTVILSLLGFFGALRFMAGNARFELALRSALGADPKALRNHVLARGLGLGLPGLVAGLVVSSVAVYFVREWLSLWQGQPWSALAIGAGSLGVLMCGSILLPATRAADAEPASVLRSE